MSEANTPSEDSRQPVVPSARRRSPVRRIGCMLALGVWALVMVTLCGFFLLATQEQIIISLGSAPDQVARAWLVSEPRERGLGFSWASLHQTQTERSVCVQTDIRFLLWAGTGESATYCDCYQRGGDDQPWELVSTHSGSCSP